MKEKLECNVLELGPFGIEYRDGRHWRQGTEIWDTLGVSLNMSRGVWKCPGCLGGCPGSVPCVSGGDLGATRVVQMYPGVSRVSQQGSREVSQEQAPASCCFLL